MEAAYGGKPTWFPFVESFWSAKRGCLEAAGVVELSVRGGLCQRPLLWTALILGFQREGGWRKASRWQLWGGSSRERHRDLDSHPLRLLLPSFTLLFISFLHPLEVAELIHSACTILKHYAHKYNVLNIWLYSSKLWYYHLISDVYPLKNKRKSYKIMRISLYNPMEYNKNYSLKLTLSWIHTSLALSK